MANILNWYEIPATNFERAVRFYETVLGVKIHAQEMNGMKVGVPSRSVLKLADASSGGMMLSDQAARSMV
jgi:predicted enzyme related to lactoylglutathione lyase